MSDLDRVIHRQKSALPASRLTAFTTVGTFPYRDAYARTARAARKDGATVRTAPGGGIAVWHGARPTSVYLAYPGSDFLVEVYDPVASRAHALVLSGDVGPIR